MSKRPRLTLVKGGRSTVHDDACEWVVATRKSLKALALRALAEREFELAEHLTRCRDALGRVEMELRGWPPPSDEGGR